MWKLISSQNSHPSIFLVESDSLSDLHSSLLHIHGSILHIELNAIDYLSLLFHQQSHIVEHLVQFLRACVCVGEGDFIIVTKNYI